MVFKKSKTFAFHKIDAHFVSRMPLSKNNTYIITNYCENVSLKANALFVHTFNANTINIYKTVKLKFKTAIESHKHNHKHFIHA